MFCCQVLRAALVHLGSDEKGMPAFADDSAILALWELEAEHRARLNDLAQFRPKLKGKAGHKSQP